MRPYETTDGCVVVARGDHSYRWFVSAYLDEDREQGVVVFGSSGSEAIPITAVRVPGRRGEPRIYAASLDLVCVDNGGDIVGLSVPDGALLLGDLARRRCPQIAPGLRSVS